MTVQENAMREFCRRIIADYCFGYGEPDGGDIQDIAARLGLIISAKATADDVASGMECDVGDEIFRFADWLQ